jgi:hypothetical protein
MTGLSASEKKEEKKSDGKGYAPLRKSPVAPHLQWKMHDVGNLRVVITNFGMIGGWDDNFTAIEDFIGCEYPAGSGIQHLTAGGIWVGAIVDTSTEPGVVKEIVKVTEGYEGWAGDQQNYLREEMYPGYAKADSIWVLSKSTPDLPAGWAQYWGNFVHKPVADQDFVCRYYDTVYNKPNLVHIPLGVQTLQRTYAWAGGYADAIVFLDFTFINMRPKTLKQAYIGFFMDMDVGPIRMNKDKGWGPRNFWADNYTAYMDENLTAYIDNPIDKPSTPLGVTIVKTPKPLDSLKVSFHWYDGSESPDPDTKRYEYLSDGIKMPSQSKSSLNDTRFLFGFGPFDIKGGDSLRLITAMVSGMTVTEMLRNADRARTMYENGYAVPPSPPNPPLRITFGEKKATLNWKWQVGDTRQNPEEFVDTTNYTAVRSSELNGRIFEGFRLYRSEDPKGSNATFSLLKEFDKPGDIWGYNTGIQYDYVDSNLTPGKTYWYAVTSFSIEDTVTRHKRESLESSISENTVVGNKAKIVMPFVVVNEKGKVQVVPNPYRVDEDYTTGIKWEGDIIQWKEEKRLIKFINLPAKCTLRIFSLAGELVHTIEHNDPMKGEEGWNLISGSNRTVASGIYLFSVESDFGTQIGKFVIIK